MNQWRRWPDDPAPADPAWNWLAKAFAMPALLATPPRAHADIALAEPAIDAAPFVGLLGPTRVRQDAEARLRHAGDELKLRCGDAAAAPDMVLLPHDETDVLGILSLCARNGLRAAIFGAGRAAPQTAPVCIDMTGITRLLSVDAASGLVEVEAGITGPELARQLAARGLMLDETIEGTLGGRLAQGAADWLADLRLATPRGLIASGFAQAAGSHGTWGAITAATIRVRSLPARQRTRGFLFPDFAAGLAALAQARAHGIAHFGVHLSDAAETDFRHRLRAMKRHPLLRWLARPVNGAALVITFPDFVAQARFEWIARGLKARHQRVSAMTDPRDLLLDRGVMLEEWHLPVRWSQLLGLRTTLSDALANAMREHSPRPGAQGLVLTGLRNLTADGGELTVTALYPRLLNGDVAQAAAIRSAAHGAIAQHMPAPVRPASDVARAIKLVLDPNGVLPV